MPCIIAISNQKGGVGKTTSSVSIAAQLALEGRRTLLIDLDPQGSAGSGLGISQRPDGQDLYDAFFGSIPFSSLLTPTKIDNLLLVPSSKDLVSLEIELGKKPGRELILRSELSFLQNRFDYVILDCPPSSGLLTLNALGAAKYILVPLQAEYYALEGISSLLSTVNFVRQTFNPPLAILGIFLTMYDARTNLSAQVEEEAKNFFSDELFRSKIPRSIKLSECPSHGLPISLYDSGSSGAKAYRELTLEIMERVERPVALKSINE